MINDLFDVTQSKDSKVQLQLKKSINTKRIMKHWEEQYPGQIHEVSYESIVNDLESTIKGTLEHIGVDFEPACLEFYNVRRIAVTPSADQVRKPIYSSSIGRHNHFAKHLNELIDLQ